MKKFNPEKELYKLKYGKRDKVIFTMIFGIILLTIGYSFALYQVKHSKRIIYTTVSDFSNNKDIILSVYLDDKEDNKFPEKNTGYIYLKTVCDNKSEAYFDTNKWVLYLEASTQDKCSVYFVSNESTPNVPELYQGMVPVVFDESGNMTVADTTNNWYDYENHKWANAVLLNYTDSAIKTKYFNEGKLRENIAGTPVNMSEVLQMYVWIPRYKYQLFNVNNESKEEQMINIIFENGTSNTGDIKCTYTNLNNGNIKEECLNKDTEEIVKNGDWYTHPAFTFGNTELTGFWVGKFESSGTTTHLTILPNKVSLNGISIKSAFDAVRNIDVANNRYNLDNTEIDTHVMKNMEWGAMAILYQSKYGIYNSDGLSCLLEGCLIYRNNVRITKNAYSSTITGCASPEADSATCEGCSACQNGTTWNAGGVKASSTVNHYGIYDIQGGSLELVMGAMADTKGKLTSIFQTAPDAKYYDLYQYGTDQYDSTRGHLGDGTRETKKDYNNNYTGGWYEGSAVFLENNSYWFERGGPGWKNIGSPLGFERASGEAHLGMSFRIVLTAQDGNE